MSRTSDRCSASALTLGLALVAPLDLIAPSPLPAQEAVAAEAGHLQDGAIVLRKPYNKAKLAATISQILN